MVIRRGGDWRQETLRFIAVSRLLEFWRILCESFSRLETAAGRFDQNQNLYREGVKTATVQRATDLTGAADAGSAIAAAGARRGAGIAVGGHNQAYSLNLQANRITYDGAVKAATQVRDASFEAARLRALSSVVSAVGHNVARDMEQGLTLRY